MKSEKMEVVIEAAVYNAADLAVDVGTNIFAARTKAGLTQEQLAKRMKTLQPSIARVENGNALPSLDFILRIAKALKTGVIAPTFESIQPVSISHTNTVADSTSLILSPMQPGEFYWNIA